jgi:hypothetical protein
MTTETTALRQTITEVLASKERDLGMTAKQARAICNAIIDADLADDDALRAYDLLADRDVFGRAF